MNVHAQVRSLDLQRFSAEHMVDEVGLRNALHYLESSLEAPDANKDLIIKNLLSIPNLFAFIMSVWPRAPEFIETILDAFPTEADLFLGSSSCTLLSQLTQLLFSSPPELFLSEISRRIGHSKIYVEDALPALTALTTENFGCRTGETTQLAGRKGKRETSNIHDSLFRKFGVRAPASAAEASTLAEDITLDLKEILQFALRLLLDPDLADFLKDAYLSPADEAGEALDRTDEAEPSRTTVEVAEGGASAHPAIQPLKAALYFDNAEGFGEWRILVSDNATGQLREIRNSDKKKFQIVVKKIKQLSNGHFSDDNQKRLNGQSFDVPIFEAKMQRDLRLVYQVDCVPERDGEVTVERQVIRIYGIHTHTQLTRIWDSVGRYLASKGKDYRDRCTFRCPAPRSGNDIFLPASFPSSTAEYGDDIKDPLPASSGDELHNLLVLEKYVRFSQGFLNALIAKEDVQHVFEISPQEHNIIDCMSSCYVLGRSGTGKTTTMLFKMFGIQRAWEVQRSSGAAKPRQIFVTKSHVLAEKVENYFKKLLASLATATYSLEELAKLKAQIKGSSLGHPSSQNRIPNSYSALEDHDFPLFVTFDDLARMIAADLFNPNCRDDKHSAMLFQDEASNSFVTYKRFAKTYWPHLPQYLTKGLEPWLVFSEFMGIIKGSEQSLAFPCGFLDQETYCGLSERTYPTFSGQREVIYSLFEAYCNLKRERRQHDMADRTRRILNALPDETSPKGQKIDHLYCKRLPSEPPSFLKGMHIDFLYVDEAQDNLLIDALLLRRMCKNPDGLFWAGDTAQTISAGSSFRLDDLKAFLHRIEENSVQERKPVPPTSFQLATNYRSHGGIVNCANSVIELITQFWPHEIDKLRPEHGIVDGTQPLFVDGWEDVAGYEFLFGGSETHIEFGHNQCILVRDDEVKEKLHQKLRERVGTDDIGLIMTLYDSKGLEFNDVLLYNFFESSPAQVTQWRIVLSALENAESKRHAASVETKYGVICSELKRLYVGITRARRNLWIVDESTKSEPMQMFWTSRSLIERCPLNEARDRLARFAVSSTPEEWAAKGHEMLAHEKYTQARICFSKARLPREGAIAEAYELRENAINTVPGHAQKRAFGVAADKFAECAGALDDAKDGIKYYHLAANCYDSAGNNDKAVEAFISAEEYDRAARQYREANLFDKTVKLLHEFCEQIPKACHEQLTDECRYFYCSRGIQPPFPLFSDDKEKLDFLEKHGLTLARARLLESLARFSEAAEAYLTAERPVNAIKAFMKDVQSHHARKRAAYILLKCLRAKYAFAIPPNRVGNDKTVQELLALAHDLPLNHLDPVVRDEISIFQSIALGDIPRLGNLAVTFIKEYRRDAPALLALDHAFARLPPLQSATYREMSTFLYKFNHYGRLLYRIIVDEDPLRHHEWLQLFRISETSNNEYAIERDSPLYRSIDQGKTHAQRPTVPSTRKDVTDVLRKYLSTHLRERVYAENSACCRSAAFSECLAFIVNGRCDQSECPSQHIPLSSLGSHWYNEYVTLHFRQTYILDYMSSTRRHLKQVSAMKSANIDWLNRLYEALFPPFYVQGTIADLDCSSIRNKWSIQRWIRDTIRALNPHGSPSEFLTLAIQLMKLAVTFDDDGDMRYIKEADWMMDECPPELLCSADDSPVLNDIFTFMEGSEPSHISSGVNALHFMLQSSLCTNLLVLCNLAEDICSSIVISLHLETYDEYDEPLHDTILPRSWLTRSTKFARGEPVDCVDLFLESVRLLLEKLRSDGVEGAISPTRAPVTPVRRAIFTSRICRMLCFLGQIPTVKDRVSNILGSLKDDPHPFYSSYIETPVENYLQALQFYDNGLRVQDLAHLVHNSRQRYLDCTKRTPPGIQRIVYKDPAKIPAQLAAQPIPVILRGVNTVPRNQYAPEAKFAIRHEDERRASTDVQTETTWSQNDRPSEGTPTMADEDVEHKQANEDVQPPTEKLAGEQTTEDAPLCSIVKIDHPTDVQTMAARVIQAAYRRRLRLYRLQPKIRTHPEVQAAFEACLKQDKFCGWKPSRYRLLYLGPLPHLLAGLDNGLSIASTVKDRIKQRQAEPHAAFEELNQQRTEIVPLCKQGHSLQKKLEPTAPFHEKRNIENLRRAVMDVKNFVESVPGDTTEALLEISVAYKAIVAERQSSKDTSVPDTETQ